MAEGRTNVTQVFSAKQYQKQRQANTVSVRKQRREEQHQARRMRFLATPLADPPQPQVVLQPQAPPQAQALAPPPTPLAAQLATPLATPQLATPQQQQELPTTGKNDDWPMPDPALQPLCVQTVPGAEYIKSWEQVQEALMSADELAQLQATYKLRQLLSSCLLPRHSTHPLARCWSSSPLTLSCVL